MKAVLYARYSSDSQTENSVEGQLKDCKEYAEKNGIMVLNTYVDRALSAKTDNRPAFQQMIADSNKRLFDIIIVWKLDRFARNRYDSAHYKHLLSKNGVKVLSATEPISDSPEGKLIESVLEGFAEYYSSELAVKVVRGMKENAHKCKFNGGTVTYGYTIDDEQHFQVDPLTAPILREIFTKYNEGKLVKDIANFFNEKGIKNGQGKKFKFNGITYILQNRRYIGEYSYRDITTENAFEPIVTREVFDKAQARFAKNTKAPARFKAVDDNYILTTKLFCGKCGGFMSGESGSGRNGVHRYYKCTNAKHKRTCDKKAVQKKRIEDLVIAETMEMLNNDKLINQLVKACFDRQNRENTALPVLQKQLEDTEKAINNMLTAIQDGLDNKSTKQRLDELEETKENIEVAILQEQIEKTVLTKEQIKFWITKWRKIDIENQEQRQKVVDIFVNSVYHYDEELIITWNYKDGTKPLTLPEVSGSTLERLGAPKLAIRRIFRWIFFVLFLIFLQKSVIMLLMSSNQ